MTDKIANFTYTRLIKEYPYAEDFFSTRELPAPGDEVLLKEYLEGIGDEELQDKGLIREEILPELAGFLEAMESLSSSTSISSLKIQGGRAKDGNPEAVESLTV
ncbi:MAG: hypothetical protein PQJ50_16875, partial [Spirochaetales bacterium]|nr:hypothetical protein [Spirochaetales bacterium]